LAAIIYRNRPDLRDAIENQIFTQLKQWGGLGLLPWANSDNFVMSLREIFGDDALEMMGRKPELREMFQEKLLGGISHREEKDVADQANFIDFAQKDWEAGKWENPDSAFQAFEDSKQGRKTGQALRENKPLQKKALEAAAQGIPEAAKRDAYRMQVGLIPPSGQFQITRAVRKLDTREMVTGVEQLVGVLASAEDEKQYQENVDKTAQGLKAKNVPARASGVFAKKALEVDPKGKIVSDVLLAGKEGERVIDKEGVPRAICRELGEKVSDLPTSVLTAMHKSEEIKTTPLFNVGVGMRYALARAKEGIGAFAREAETQEFVLLLGNETTEVVEAVRTLDPNTKEDVTAVQGHLVAAATRRAHVPMPTFDPRTKTQAVLQELAKTGYAPESPDEKDRAILDALLKGQPELVSLIDKNTQQTRLQTLPIAEAAHSKDDLAKWMEPKTRVVSQIADEVRELKQEETIDQVAGQLGGLVGHKKVGVKSVQVLQGVTGSKWPGDETGTKQDRARKAAIDAADKKAQPGLRVLLGVGTLEDANERVVRRLLDRYPASVIMEGVKRSPAEVKEKLQQILEGLHEGRLRLQPKKKEEIVKILTETGYEKAGQVKQSNQIDIALDEMADHEKRRAACQTVVNLLAAAKDPQPLCDKIAVHPAMGRGALRVFVEEALTEDRTGVLLAQVLLSKNSLGNPLVQGTEVAPAVVRAAKKLNIDLASLPPNLLAAMKDSRGYETYRDIRQPINAALQKVAGASALREANNDVSSIIQKAHTGEEPEKWAQLLSNKPDQVADALRKAPDKDIDELADLLAKANRSQAKAILAVLGKSAYLDKHDESDRKLIEALLESQSGLEKLLDEKVRDARIRTVGPLAAARTDVLARWMERRNASDIAGQIKSLGKDAAEVAGRLGQLVKDRSVGAKTIEVLQELALADWRYAASTREAALEAVGDRDLRADLAVLLGDPDKADLESKSLAGLLKEYPVEVVARALSHLEDAKDVGDTLASMHENLRYRKQRETIVKVLEAMKYEDLDRVLKAAELNTAIQALLEQRLADVSDQEIAEMPKWVNARSTDRLRNHAKKVLDIVATDKALADTVARQLDGERSAVGILIRTGIAEQQTDALTDILCSGSAPLVTQPGVTRAICDACKRFNVDLTSLPQRLLDKMGYAPDMVEAPGIRASVGDALKSVNLVASSKICNEIIREMDLQVARFRTSKRYENKPELKEKRQRKQLIGGAQRAIGKQVLRMGAKDLMLASEVPAAAIYDRLKAARDRASDTIQKDAAFSNENLRLAAEAITGVFQRCTSSIVGKPEVYATLQSQLHESIEAKEELSGRDKKQITKQLARRFAL
ncbi:hypothetical protein ACFL6C_13245, partial [Myxococcota bacterium]